MLLAIIYGLQLSLALEFKLTPRQSKQVKSSRIPTSSLVLSHVSNIFNVEYNVLIEIGTPGSPFSLVINPSYPYTWVPSSVCACHPTDHKFDETTSSSFAYSGSEGVKQLDYEYGVIKGKVAKDNFRISNLNVTGQSFILVNEDENLYDMYSDGALGLSFPRKGEFSEPTFIENLKSQGLIKEMLFSIYLSNYFVNDQEDSILTIGEYDLAKYGNGDSTDIKIDSSQGHWLGSLTEFKVGNDGVAENAVVSFEVDFPFMIIPLSKYSMFTDQVNEAVSDCVADEIIICPCSQEDYQLYPNLNYMIDNNLYEVSPESYIYYDEGYCYLLVIGYEKSWVLGQPFFRDYYTVYDLENSLIKASKANHSRNENVSLKVSGFVGAWILAGLGLRYFGRMREDNYHRLA